MAPAIAAVDDLLVGQHRAAFGTPVDAAFFTVSEAALEHAQEEPLVPAIVFGLAGGDFAAPVVAEAEAAQDALEFSDVVVGPRAGMRLVLDGSVFGGQAEGIPAHGMEHVEAAHAFYARHHVADGVIAHVAHVERAGGIRQHLQRVILELGGICFCLDDARFGPALLPLGFDLLWVVFSHAELSPSAPCFWLRGRFLCGPRKAPATVRGRYMCSHLTACCLARFYLLRYLLFCGSCKHGETFCGFGGLVFQAGEFPEGGDVAAVVARIVDGCFGEERAAG